LLLLASQLPLAALMTMLFLTRHKFTGILVIESDIAVASVIFAVASFHLLASLMWIASLHLLIFLLLLVSRLLLAFLLRMSDNFAI
jgi:hypothetical protein